MKKQTQNIALSYTHTFLVLFKLVLEKKNRPKKRTIENQSIKVVSRKLDKKSCQLGCWVALAGREAKNILGFYLIEEKIKKQHRRQGRIQGGGHCAMPPPLCQ